MLNVHCGHYTLIVRVTKNVYINGRCIKNYTDAGDSMLLPLPPSFPLETEAEDEEAADGEDEKAESNPKIVRRPGAVEVEDVELERTPSCCCVWRFRPRHRCPTPFCPR